MEHFMYIHFAQQAAIDYVLKYFSRKKKYVNVVVIFGAVIGAMVCAHVAIHFFF